MNAQQLQAAYIRRREADFARIERTQAVNKYYDHWTKVNSRFEAWTDPDYYQQADEAMRKEKEKREKDKKLEIRRKKLKQLLAEEDEKNNEELSKLNHPKPRKLSTDLLAKLGKDQDYLKEERRRLDLESKLYGKWRYGINDENILFNSKTDNETLAKLSWLDKQIENQMLREQELKEAEERQLRLLEETRKREENLKEQSKIREAQIKELRSIQESHLTELKGREMQSNELHDKESRLRRVIEKIETELTDFQSRKIATDRPKSDRNPHNIKRIKMFIRQRSEQVRDDLKADIELLDRILACRFTEEVHGLRNAIEVMYKTEVEKQSSIEAMYESEAKQSLAKWEENWGVRSEQQQGRILYLLRKIKDDAEAELAENLEQQKQLIQIRETHLGAIDSSNDKLKNIVDEQETVAATCRAASALCKAGAGDGVDTKEMNKDIANLNISDDSPRRPKFGRKKVAWL